MTDEIKSFIEDKIAKSEPQWVKLWDDTIVCVTGKYEDGVYKAKFIPCAKNSREYRIKERQIKELYEGRDWKE